MMVQAQEEIGEGSANPTDPHHTPTIIQQSTSQPQKKQKPRKPKRKDTEVPQPSGPIDNVTDKVVYEEMDDSLERAATTATSLDAEQDRGNINKTQSKATLKEPSSIRTSSCSGPRRQDTIAQTGDEDMFGVNDLEGDEVIVETEVDHEVVVETEVASKDVNLKQGTITTTTAATTVTAASTRPKAKGLVIHENEQATTPTVSSQQPSHVKVQEKGKGIMVEEPLKMKKKYQISFDEQEAIRLQAEFDEYERLTREKDEVNVVLTEEWNDIQAKIDDDYQKHFAAKRAKKKRNRPPTRAQQRSIMCTYLKNMEGWKPKRLKNKSFANIQELFDKAFKRVNIFVDYRTKLVEESSNKAEVMEKSSKKAEADIAQ
ncbi:hypothetical protein Tco_0891063 [Tanacetum coccineum]|uniref:Uncharacterized protein n=1 Tax=Tanacetum coccineum TaxID=301880 RepID=A0ABQ5C1T8_9ASTR